MTEIAIGSQWRGKPGRGLQKFVATIKTLGPDYVFFAYEESGKKEFNATWSPEPFLAEWEPIQPEVGNGA